MNKLKEVEGGEIILYNNLLAEIVGYKPSGSKSIIIEPLTDEGKDKCPHCSKPIPTRFHVIEGCLNWKEDVKPVKTL